MSLQPRAVVVTRPTEWQALLARHATAGQARFFLETHDRPVAPLLHAQSQLEQALLTVEHAIPMTWRQIRIDRSDLDRFLFEPDDVVIAVGQDGLVANVAKYVSEQLVIGVNPDPSRYDGVLVQLQPETLGDCITDIARGRSWPTERRTMAEARLDDGQTLVALNEVFLGHRSHQSARYRLQVDGDDERQSSSGIIVATGTGATGWARSIARERNLDLDLPSPCTRRLAWFVREAFPSVATGVSRTSGIIGNQRSLAVTSELEAGGVIFGDGIETDHLEFDFGQSVTVGIASRALHLAQSGASAIAVTA